MFSTSKRLKVENILNRIANEEPVSLNERIYLKKLADKNQTVASWLKRSRKLQQRHNNKNGIDQLLDSLNLGTEEPYSEFNPENEDLGDWFMGCPSWLARS